MVAIRTGHLADQELELTVVVVHGLYTRRQQLSASSTVSCHWAHAAQAMEAWDLSSGGFPG